MGPEIWPANIRLPMLPIPEKKTTFVDLYRPLHSDIAQEYSEVVAKDLTRDIHKLNELRLKLPHLAKVPSFNTRWGILSSYFRGLCLVETLSFSAKGQFNNLTFTWHDAFNNNKKASQRNIHLDKAAVLFNVGAVCSQIAQSKDRRTNQNREEAVHEFCRAARAFAYLRDDLADLAAMGLSITVDVSVECTGMLHKLMLAQAQECQFEIAIAQGNTPEACAQVSLQVALYYEEALAAQNAQPLKGHIVQDWKTYMQLKAALFNAVACYGHALKLREENGVAQGIAKLESGISTLSKAEKLTPGGPLLLLFASTEIKMIVEAIKKLEAMMKSSLEMAKEEIGYVPPLDSLPSLPSLPPCSTIKQPPIEEVLVARNKNLFPGFVHHSSAKALTRYAEQVRGVIHTHKRKLHQCRAHVRKTLKEMDLPDFILALEGQLTLPANLEEGWKKVQHHGGRAGLETALLQLGKQKQETLELVVQTEEHVQSRPQSSTQSKNLQDITDKLKQAAETYAKIQCLIKNHSARMSILDHQTIESALPVISLDADDNDIVGDLKNSLGKLKTLNTQGKRLRRDLKHMFKKDDIQPKLLAPTSSQEDLFKKEISKYDPTCKEIDQNIEAREQLLSQIQAQNDRLSPFSNIEKNKASRQKSYRKIRTAIALYQKIMENINQAENFYIDVQNTVKNAKRRCGEFQGPKMMGLESDIHGQAASDLVAGSDSEAAILRILEMGGGTWDRGTVARALRAAHNNTDRAVDLSSGIPEQAEVPPGAQAASPPAQPAQPAQPATGQLPSAMPQAVTFTPEEREAMERLEAMGFDRERV